MKFILTFNLIFLFGLCFGQTPEQLVLNFYALNILKKPIDEHFVNYYKKIKLRYDRHISPIDSQYQELARLIVSEYNNCKNDPRGANNSEIKRTSDEWKPLKKNWL
ncbi:hypothetical protein [Chondrinema litorale]|uniref:hypothetical protein n=1 Tax=Chondrinema litorale TaxID=2994555 RepID=UPI00254347D7|nr:hypothetical protein [Chondrinema litorale]UZR96293.1 hypothetical protein OQ292_21775 [Chondrinema litorale]